MTTTDPFADWDAAYVLGALSVSDRRAYEEHLEVCDRCAHSVAELAALPGLLGTLPAAEGLAMLSDPAAGVVESAPGRSPSQNPDLLTGLASKVRRYRRRRTWAIGVAAVAVVAAVVAGAVVVPNVLPGDTPQAAPAPTSSAIDLDPVSSSNLEASVRFAGHTWGTEVDMTCFYARSGGSRAYEYGLYVTDSAGNTSLVSTWSAAPGSTARTTGSIAIRADAVRRIEIREQSSGIVLLSKSI